MVIVAIESPPGGGKGFLLKNLGAHGLGKEPVRVCLQDDAIDHVMDYLKDPERWILVKELHFLWKHVVAIRDAPLDHVTFIEGSPLTDFFCYFEPAKKHPFEERLYKDWYKFLRSSWDVDAHVRLVASPHDHLDRIIGNSKKEQGNTTILTLYKMDCDYKRWLGHAHDLICYSNFEDNEPAMEIMRHQLDDIVQMLKNNSWHRSKPHSSCPS
jgi:hypothetical protein